MNANKSLVVIASGLTSIEIHEQTGHNLKVLVLYVTSYLTHCRQSYELANCNDIMGLFFSELALEKTEGYFM